MNTITTPDQTTTDQTQVTLQDETQDLSPESVIGQDVDVILHDLESMANDFSDHVQGIRLMQENGFFKFASKNLRNDLLDNLQKMVGALDETTKVAFRALKRVKRERVPEEVVDSLLISTLTPGRI